MSSLLPIITYYTLLQHITTSSIGQSTYIPLNFSVNAVKQIFKVLHRAVLVKWTHQTKGLDERLIPELEEERITIGRLAVNVVYASPGGANGFVGFTTLPFIVACWLLK